MSIGMYYIKDSSAEAVVDALKKKRIFSDLCFEGIDLNTLDSMEDEEISLGLSGLPKYSSLIWGEGEMHHTSLAMSPKAKFIKSVDDGHSDYFDFSSRDLNPLYATHNSVLMNLNPNVIEIESLGSGYIMFSDSVYKKNKAISFFRQKFPGRLSAGYESFRVHKSIDFDVLHGFPARTYYQDCDGGTMPFQTILNEFEVISTKHKVERLDLGGLYIPSEEESLNYGAYYNPLKNAQVMDFAIACYQSILEVWLHHINLDR